MSGRSGPAKEDRFQIFQLRIQYSLPCVAGIHHARISAAVNRTIQGSQRLRRHNWLRG